MLMVDEPLEKKFGAGIRTIVIHSTRVIHGIINEEILHWRDDWLPVIYDVQCGRIGDWRIGLVEPGWFSQMKDTERRIWFKLFNYQGDITLPDGITGCKSLI